MNPRRLVLAGGSRSAISHCLYYPPRLLLTGGLKVFEIPLALTRSGPGFETHTITHVIVLRGISETQYGLASAMSIAFFLIALLIAYFQVTFMQKREERNR
jgi:raffinose/stachyose/melibiose transport system permease protein